MGIPLSNAPARPRDHWSLLLRGLVVEPVQIEPELGAEQPENMTEQAERPLKLKGERLGVDKCGPEWPGRRPKHGFSRERECANTILLQRYSRMERVTGIEPALSAWELIELMGFVLGSLRVSRPRAAWNVFWMPAVMAR